ncbi:MAG: ABC transporter permease [Armatimonadota bacterium]|nr:ABC transporter permease [Armatimonadota bacterium]MDR7453020.1 ABC transporter permease [Armatimonadota bacterium]MDR7496355.1 ABC transporter permease [Armatimonadota bacterium]MDR7510561.1 ABC transporter permease [Armatimonadota bacterium]
MASTPRPAEARVAAAAVALVGPEPARTLWRIAARRLRRNPPAMIALAFLVAVHLAAAIGPALLPTDPFLTNPLLSLRGSSAEHPLGTDEVGRDVLARLILGARVSLAVGFVAMVISVSLGVAVGAIAGYAGRWEDVVLMRLTDAMMALPTLFVILAALAVFGGGPVTATVVIGLTAWMPVARVVRGEFLRWRVTEFVDAARAIGARDGRIMVRHILPQVVPSIIVAATLNVAFAILTESAISYLGLGIRPPLPSWGNMLQNAQIYIWSAPNLAVYPGVLILCTVLAYNFLGDGLRDALDPRLKL